MRKVALLILLTYMVLQASAQNVLETNSINTNWLLNKMQQDAFFNPYLAKGNNYNIQIIYTQIDRLKDSTPLFTHYSYQLNDNNYFYPASTVKFPTSVLAAHKVWQLQQRNANININNAFITEAQGYKQDVVYNDPTSQDGKPSIAHYIKKIFLVSDNDANNRLYEFLGQQFINETLQKKGYKNAAIKHRLSIPDMTEADHASTNPFAILDDNGSNLFASPLQKSNFNFGKKNITMGNGFMQGEKLVNKPFDFSKKNVFPLTALHCFLQDIIFPNPNSKQHIEIDSAARQFILKCMSQYPQESKYPFYDKTAYPEAYCKFLMYGAEAAPIPKNIRIFNKIGEAYGFLTDVAYVIDTVNKVEFMLSATIYTNKDGIFNDDKYEYDTEGFPFLKQLGQLIYKHELQRNKTFLPNVTPFIFNYNE
jgi:hypothetical protein